MPLNDGSLTFSGNQGFRGDRSNTVRIEGDGEVIERLLSLPSGTTKYLSGAIKASMRPMRSQLLMNTPQGPTGNTRMSVGEKVAIYESGVAFGVVGYRRAVSKKDHRDQKGFASHLLEFGTRERRPRNGTVLSSQGIAGWRPPGWSGRWPMVARSVGRMRAQHPMLRAYMATASQCASILEAESAAALTRAIKDSGGGG
jgi:hypothetical protein